jgi:hypothetical protein
MSLLLPAVGAGAAVFYLANRWDSEMRMARQARKERVKRIPNSNTFTPYSTHAQAKITPDQIADVEADVDLRGVPFFHVTMKGSGVKVRSYRDPRNNGIGYDH